MRAKTGGRGWGEEKTGDDNTKGTGAAKEMPQEGERESWRGRGGVHGSGEGGIEIKRDGTWRRAAKQKHHFHYACHDPHITIFVGCLRQKSLVFSG